VIDRDGTLAFGRPLARMGTHVEGNNKGTVGVALMGGHGSAATDVFSDYFTIDRAGRCAGVLKISRINTQQLKSSAVIMNMPPKPAPGLMLPAF
tara:strand:- start:1524 stop:1805 length:282 start_codon:yes stop_codon:yes gene_type:complete